MFKCMKNVFDFVCEIPGQMRDNSLIQMPSVSTFELAASSLTVSECLHSAVTFSLLAYTLMCIFSL